MTESQNPQQVFGYYGEERTDDSSLARIICGVTIIYAATNVGCIAARTFSNGNLAYEQQTTDIPAALCGLALMLFGFLALFRIARSRFAIGFLSGFSILFNWSSAWLLTAGMMKGRGWFDEFEVANTLLVTLQSAIAPGFVIICLQLGTVRNYFDRRRRF